MKKFRFRLEQVLRVRRLQEDMARAELMHAHREARAAADRVNGRIADYTGAPRPDGEQPIHEFNRVQFHLDNAAQAITLARASYQHALEIVDDRRSDWAAARQRVAALERLEARRREEYAVEASRIETAKPC